MALLQISEPDASPDPHRRRHVVGIDLGTTHSLVAAVRHGVAECLPDAEGRVLLPSAVRYLADGRTEVGDAALAHRVDDPHNTIVSVKRLMGRARRDVDPASNAAFEFADEPAAASPSSAGEGMVRLRTVAGPRTPVEVSAEILAVLRRRAEDTLDADLDGAVVTVPAYFDDAQRQATKDAAERAGLDVLRLVSEPTAAAIAYGLDRGSEGLYAVYDLGGGTFDLSLLRLSQGVFEVVATGGDTALGGDDVDAALAGWLLQRAGRRADDASARRAVAIAARAAKEALSQVERVEAAFDLGGHTARVEVARTDLEALAAPWIERTLVVARRVMRDAGMAPSEIQGVVLVGGATRMPLVRRAVASWSGHEPLVDHDPDQVVALGAALHAEALAGNPGPDGVLLLDVTALSLGIETMGGLVERIIPRNTPIPTARAQTFTTFQDGQRAMAIHVVQGEREMVADCRSLARFELRGIPPMAAGAARIQVTFAVDADGLLAVSAREETTGIEAAVTVKPSYGLAEEDVARMLQEGFGAADADAAARALRESQVEADRLVTATRSALAADGDLVEPAERTAIDAALHAVCDACTAHDRPALEAAVRTLANVTEPFAAARMNRGIARALAGRRVDDV